MNRIRQLREEKKITQVRLSVELGVSQENISAYETGKYYPSVKSLLKLREIFGVNIDYILGLSNTRTDYINTDSLRPDEQILIENFQKLDHIGKQRVIGYIEGYLDAFRQIKE